MSTSYATSGRLAYLKLALVAALMRGGFKVLDLMSKSPLIPDPTPQETLEIRSTKGTRSIRVFVHRNKAAQQAFKEGRPTAVHIHWYGGGWILPYDPSLNAPMVRALLDSPELADYPLTIVEATYALSPQHSCPASLEDGRDVYSHFASHPQLYDANRITVSGASAGGAIALGLSVMLAQEQRQNVGVEASVTGHPIKGVVALYPVVSWIDTLRKVREFSVEPQQDGEDASTGVMMPSFVLDIIAGCQFASPTPFWDTPLSKEEDEKRKKELMHRPSVSTALADLADFPPTVKIWTAQYDVLSLDADELRERLEAREDGSQKGKCGRNVKGVGHGWDMEVAEGQTGWKERIEAMQDLVEVVARAGD